MTTIKLQRLAARFRQTILKRLNLDGQTYVQHRVAEYRAMWRAVADELGASFVELADDAWELRLNGRRTRVLNDLLEFDDPVTLQIAGRKPLVYQLLRERGLRVPDHLVFRLDQLEEAYGFLERHSLGCVVKPADGTSSGQGVTTHVQTRRELKRAAILASLYCRSILIEPLVAGECYRVLMLRGQMIHAVRRRGLRVHGDGRSSLSRLLSATSQRRETNGQAPITIDRDCLFTVRAQGLTLDYVPDSGQEVLVKSIGATSERAELRTVYDETVTDGIGDALRANAEQAACALGSALIGVDFITPDASIPLEESGGVINEVNTTPGLHHHYQAAAERYPRPALPIASVLLGISR
jgi:D-alanine-D-alanine ligase-like ATP-grasp enzyme